MRNPLLRILVALLLGVVTPLCCCVIQTSLGNACGNRHAAAVTIDTCCTGCSNDPASDFEQDTPADDQQPSQEDCPSCPSCQGTSGGTGAKAEVTLTALEHQWNALATMALAVLWNLPTTDIEAVASAPGWADDPPHLKANREALRWHCALLV